MDGMPFTLNYLTNTASYVTVWTRLYNQTNTASDTAYFDSSVTSAEVLISFFTVNGWTTPVNVTNNNEFDGAAVAAAFYPSKNPVANLLVVWIHKPDGGLYNSNTSSDIMYRIYNFNNKWNPVIPVC